MKLGVALETVDLQSGRPVPVQEVSRQAARAEELGFASAWVMDHLFIDGGAVRRGALDPFVTLAHAAGSTSSITLGTMVVCNGFRSTGQLARESIALASASSGRFVLGLGSGWHRNEFDAFDVSFERRVSYLEETLPPLKALMRGARVSVEGARTTLRDASLPVAGAAPPLWIAARGERMLELTAREADGWNVAWGGPDPAWAAGLIDSLGEACEKVGRTRRSVEVSVGILAIPADAARDDERMVIGPPERIAEVARAYQAVGVQHLILSLAPAPFARADQRHLERAAAVVALLGAEDR